MDTVIAGRFRERIAPGAFLDAIGPGQDVAALFNHDPNQVLGRTTSGTLRLEEAAASLAFAVDINPDDPQALGVLARVKRGDVRGASFSFTVGDEAWDYPKDGLPIRTILRVDELFDVGPVCFPAYKATRVQALEQERNHEPHWTVRNSAHRLRRALWG
jgi:HK97 family phage prohead protease